MNFPTSFQPDFSFSGFTNQLRQHYQQLLKRYTLLFGYGVVVYYYSQSEHRMVKALQLHAGENDILVKDLDRYIPALSGKATTVFRTAEATQRTAIVPKDMISGETYLTVVTPKECLILGFKGGNTTTNHNVVSELLRIIADFSSGGQTAEHAEPLQFNPTPIMAAAI